MAKYSTLLVKFAPADAWSIQFGDFDGSVVREERDDSYSDAWACKIIRTAPEQAAIDAEVARLNALDKPATTERSEALAVIDDMDPTDIVGDVYDDNENFAAALAVLIPGFEYPDWSHKTVEQVSRRVSRI